MDLGVTERLKPLLEQVRQMVEDEIIPSDDAFHAEIGSTGDRFHYTPKMIEILDGLKAKKELEELKAQVRPAALET